jgi:hypothetical protein
MSIKDKKKSLPKFRRLRVITGSKIERAGGLDKWAEQNGYHNTGANQGTPVPISDEEFLKIATQSDTGRTD